MYSQHELKPTDAALSDLLQKAIPMVHTWRHAYPLQAETFKTFNCMKRCMNVVLHAARM